MRSSPRHRLYALLLALLALYVLLAVFRPLDEDAIRSTIEPLGWAAPVAFVPLSAALGAMLVPGAVLATVSGVLFGVWVGFAAALAASVLSALLARAIAERGGRPGFEEVAGRRLTAASGAVARSGTWGVVVQRLLPAVPDGPANYAFGLAGITWLQLALGTLIGSAPRALGYTALGDSLDDVVSPTGALAIALIGGAGALGLLLALLAARRSRRNRASTGERSSLP